MEQFTRQQLFAQVVGSQEVYQVTIDLIARINLNDQAIINVHVGNNVNEDPEE